MANKKINELQSRVPSLTDLMLVGDPSSGYSYRCTVHDIANIIEGDIGDTYVTLTTTQTISGAKTFSNNLTLTSVTNASVDTDKFLVLNASNIVNFRTGSEVLSDIGGQGTISLTTSGTSGAATFSSNTLNIPQYQGALTLTTTGTSGAATLVGNTLNIPNYAPDLSGYVPTSRTITINGTTQDLSANRTYNVGTVTSVAASAGTGISISGSPITSSGTITITNTAPDQVVALTAGTGISVSGTYPNFTITNLSPSLGGTVTSVALSAPTGFSVTGSPVTTSGTLGLTFASGYSLPTTASQVNWDSAYNNMIVSAAVTGTTTKTLTLTQQDAGTITASWTDNNTDAVTSVFGRTGAVVAVSGDYTTAQVTESGNLYYTDARARAALSAGTGISYSSTTGVISSTITQYTDALARAAISLTTTGSSGAATYSSSTGVLNVPTYTLTGLGGVPTTRTITINGTAQDLSTDRTFSVGTVTSVAATAGTGISISGSPITSSGTLTITNTAPDQVVALTAGTGISTSGTYPNFTITNSAPDQTVALTAGSNITITGTYPNFTIAASGGSGSVTSVALTTGTTGTDISVSGSPITTSGTFTLNIPTASATNRGALSSTDWTTFNNKQNALTLTTTGTSGAATLVGATLNIPQYQSVLTNPVTGTGTTNRLAKFTGASTIGDSSIEDLASSVAMTISSGGSIGVGTSAPDASYMATILSNTDYKGLLITGNSHQLLQVQSTAAAKQAILSLKNGGQQYSLTLDTDNAFKIYDNTATTNRIIINTTGNLGINTSTIGSRLQVNGNAAIGYSASTAAPTNGLQVSGSTLLANSSGTVSIGIALQTDKLFIYNASGTNNALTIQQDGTGDIVRFNGNSGVNRFLITQAGIAFIGNGDAVASPNTGILSASGGSGTNIAGAEFRIRGGASTGSGAGGPITFYTSAAGSAGTGVNAATEKARIDASGNLTVVSRVYGTTTGLNSDFNSGGLISYSAGNTLKYTQIGYDNSGNYGWIQSLIQGTAYSNLIINPAGGNLGIGTTTIGSKLQVNGNAAIGYSASTAAPTNGLAVSGNVGLGTTAPTTYAGYTTLAINGSTAGVLDIMNNGTVRGQISGGAAEFYLEAKGATAVMRLLTNSAERMRITSDGNVFVGATSSAYTAANRTVLTVNGTNQALVGLMTGGTNRGYFYSDGTNVLIYSEPATGYMAFGTANAERMRITSGGLVGIGTTSPASLLSLSGSADVGMRIKAGAANLSFIDFDEADSGAPNGSIAYNHGTNAMIFGTGGSNAERMRITSGGDVAIGTTTASAKLHVNGDIRTSAPSGGTAANWKLGSKVASSVAFDDNDYLEVEVGGVAYKVALVTLA